MVFSIDTSKTRSDSDQTSHGTPHTAIDRCRSRAYDRILLTNESVFRAIDKFNRKTAQKVLNFSNYPNFWSQNAITGQNVFYRRSPKQNYRPDIASD